MNVLAFDLGASNGRCILGAFDGQRLNLEEIGRFDNAAVELGHDIFWDILWIYNNIKRLTGECVNKKIKISSIGVNSWAQDYGLVGNGTLLTQVRSYRDPYTDGIFNTRHDLISPERLFRLNGTAPFKGATLYQLAAAARQNPGLFNGDIILQFIPNLISYFMTGVTSCDCTLASFSQIYNNTDNCWSGDIINTFGIPRILPSADIPGRIIGYTNQVFKEQTGLKPVPVALVAGHDTASAVYGAMDKNHANTLYLSSGTWSMLAAHVDEPVTDHKTAGDEYYNAAGANGNRLLIRGVTGLWILQECIKIWRRDGYEIDAHILEKGFDNDICGWFDADDPRLFHNYDMNAAVRELLNENGFSAGSNAAVYHAILDSMARKYKHITEIYETIINKKFDKIKIIGGGLKNKLLNDLTGKYTGKRIETGHPEASAVGNILLQLQALGELDINDRPVIEGDGLYN